MLMHREDIYLGASEQHHDYFKKQSHHIFIQFCLMSLAKCKKEQYPENPFWNLTTIISNRAIETFLRHASCCYCFINLSKAGFCIFKIFLVPLGYEEIRKFLQHWLWKLKFCHFQATEISTDVQERNSKSKRDERLFQGSSDLICVVDSFSFALTTFSDVIPPAVPVHIPCHWGGRTIAEEAICPSVRAAKQDLPLHPQSQLSSHISLPLHFHVSMLSLTCFLLLSHGIFIFVFSTLEEKD